MSQYKRIDRDNGRVFIIGDLHGEYDKLMSLLSDNLFNTERDIVISVGDLIDRGPDSLRCLELMNESWFFPVFGNHEQLAYGALRGIPIYEDLWMENGGEWYSKLSDADKTKAYNFIDKAYYLPRIIELNAGGKKLAIMHAYYPDPFYEFGKDVQDELVIWHRDEAKRAKDLFNEVEPLLGVDYAVFGHNRVTSKIQSANKIFIDTSCGYGYGILTAMVVDALSGDITYVESRN